MGDKKLYRSKSNNVFLGVCGGIGEYLNVDSTVIRLLWVIFTMAGGSGLIAYIVAALIMPYQNYESEDTFFKE